MTQGEGETTLGGDGTVVRLDPALRSGRTRAAAREGGGIVSQALLNLLERRGLPTGRVSLANLTDADNRVLMVAIVEALISGRDPEHPGASEPLPDAAMVEILRVVHRTTGVALRELGEAPAM